MAPNPIAARVKPTGKPIAVAIVVAMTLAGCCTKFISLDMPFGGALPGTITDPEWAKATKERMLAWPREGAPDRPIMLNPMKHMK
eukprot:CAMPEP_0198684102 /NCGR_PEP_ID=MMETSP1468-20131203/11722_1 /TAXON_ID=1461545 /ORGANISM="Mantoniella sp, Strain CCMP1436" /LENGTH=84 /DNA_ID=CAMNT_0044428685 /DNA_START=27 /DNA_END=281 /DNA_ORIENTATION=-